MDIINELIAYLKIDKEETKGKTPNGLCPICWGYQEYDNKIRKVLKDKQIDVNNHRDSYMKVQKFVVKYIDGIRLQEGKIESCPTCGGHGENAVNSMANKNIGSKSQIQNRKA